jgi:hypothetical protein
MQGARRRIPLPRTEESSVASNSSAWDREASKSTARDREFHGPGPRRDASKLSRGVVSRREASRSARNTGSVVRKPDCCSARPGLKLRVFLDLHDRFF